MMKKNRLLLTLASILLISSVVGCSSDASSGEQAKTTTEESTNKDANAKMMSFEDIDVYGEVSEVIGNEVTLKLLKIPEMPANGQNPQNGEKGENVTGTPPTDGTGGSGERPQGGGMREKQYTGEEKTIIIPVGTPLMTTARGENGMTESEISLNELTSGSTMSISYKEDGKTIEKINVRKPRTGGGGQGGPGNPGEMPRN
jgi:hypothetical protein